MKSNCGYKRNMDLNDALPAVEHSVEEVLVILRQIIRATDLRSKQIAKQTGMTTAQLVVLQSIARLGEVTTREISHRVSLSQATVTTIMDRLSERGFIERYRSAMDRRVVYTRLTAKGRSAIASAPTLLHEEFAVRFKELSSAEQRRIVANLKRVAVMMDATELDAAPMLATGPAVGETRDQRTTQDA